jgi:hypothetical protein
MTLFFIHKGVGVLYRYCFCSRQLRQIFSLPKGRSEGVSNLEKKRFVDPCDVLILLTL